jgi:Ni,Fe-hydrogenase I small subunit
MKFCTLVSATIGLAPSFAPKIAEALASPQRPPVVWLSFAECTGCTEALLRTSYPWIDTLAAGNHFRSITTKLLWLRQVKLQKNRFTKL